MFYTILWIIILWWAVVSIFITFWWSKCPLRLRIVSGVMSCLVFLELFYFINDGSELETELSQTQEELEDVKLDKSYLSIMLYTYKFCAAATNGVEDLINCDVALLKDFNEYLWIEN